MQDHESILEDCPLLLKEMGDRKHSKQSKSKSGSSSAARKRPQGPPLFSSFGKKAIELIAGGYSKDHKLSISTRSDIGVTLISNAVLGRGRLSTAAVAGQYNYKDAKINVHVDAKSAISTALTLSRKFLPSLESTASLNLPNYKSSMLQLQYNHEHATLATSLLLNRASEVHLSASFGTSSLAFGILTQYKITSSKSGTYEVGMSVRNPNYDASITVGNNGDFLRASCIHYFDQDKKVAAVAMISRRFSKQVNALIVGGSWILDDQTTVKARIDNHGKMMTLLQHKNKPKSCWTISSEFDAKALNKIPGIGLSLCLQL